MSDNQVIVFADKTVLKISGLTVKGLNTRQLEQALSDRLHSIVRVIGVTGTNIDMDIYGLEPEQILADEDGIIKAVSATEGITATDVVGISKLEKAVSVNCDRLPDKIPLGCAKERWMFK